MDEPLTVLVAARDEEGRIGRTVAALREAFPDAEVVVADDGSHDGTAEEAEAAGAIVLRLPRRGKGQTLSAGERAAAPGRLLVCDADLSGDLRPLLESQTVLRRRALRAPAGWGIRARQGTASAALIRLLTRVRRFGSRSRGSERSPREPAPRASRSRPGSAARCG